MFNFFKNIVGKSKELSSNKFSFKDLFDLKVEPDSKQLMNLANFVYGTPLPSKKADLGGAITISYEKLLKGSVDKAELSDLAIELYKSPFAFSTDDLALVIALYFFASPSHRLALMGEQVTVRQYIFKCVEDGSINKTIAKTFVDRMLKIERICDDLFAKFGQIVIKIAIDVGDNAVVCGSEFIEMISKNYELKTNGSEISNITNEFFYFFIHYINRLSYSYGGSSGQVLVYESIAREAVKQLSLQTFKVNDAVQILQTGIGETEREYAKCIKYVAEGSAAKSGTLYWEASKRISESTISGLDITAISYATKLIGMALDAMKLEEKIKTLVEQVAK